MGIILHLVTCLICIEAILSHPLQQFDSPLYNDNSMGLAKKDFYHPFNPSLLSTLGYLANSRGSQNRKKAVDSTFIRFGRSSPLEEANLRIDAPKSLSEDQDESTDNSKATPPQRFILNHKGCQISNSKELVRALMNDRNCIRAFQKVKKENVNDTFIRFGKRSVPSEENFESQNSEGV